MTTVHDKVLAIATEDSNNLVTVRYLADYRHGMGYRVEPLAGKTVVISLRPGESVKAGDMLRVEIGDKIDRRFGKLTGVILGHVLGA